MIRQNISTLSKPHAKQSWRMDGTAALVHRATASPPKRGVCVPEKGPSFLKTYVIPVLLFNLAIDGWTLGAMHVVQGEVLPLGYALIIIIGLRLYLSYLDHYVR